MVARRFHRRQGGRTGGFNRARKRGSVTVPFPGGGMRGGRCVTPNNRGVGNKRKPSRGISYGNKRRKYGSRTGTDVIQKRAEFGDQYVQNIRRFIRQGRKLRTVPYLSKLASADNSAPYDLGHRVYTNFSVTPSEVLGLNTYNGVDTYFPIFAFDLMSANYQKTVTNTFLAPAVLRMTYDSANARTNWSPRTGMDPDGTFTSNNQGMQPNGLKVGDNKVIFNRSFCEYVSMNFNVTGPTSKPARVTFQLVVFTNAWADPFGANGYWASGLSQENTMHGRYWAAEAARLVENPIHKIARYTRGRPYRVLSTKVIDFQPTSSTETDTRGHIQTVKWFRRVNKVLNYAQRDMGAYNATTIESTSLMAPINAAQSDNFANRPQASARYVLLVKGNCWDLDTGAVPNTTTNSRIEWNITTRHRVPNSAIVALPNP